MSMYNNRKGPAPAPCPSDAQAREKLALYVYEYLHHIGAKGAAETFLKEIRWEKNITLGEPPGFLHSWWCVFWDLYCAAPERRDSCEHSQEAKAFHDYGFVNPSAVNQFPPPPQVNGMHGPPNATPSPLGMPPQGEGLPPGAHPLGPGGGHPGFFGGVQVRPSPPQGSGVGVSQSSPHPGGPGMSVPTSYPGGPRPPFSTMRPPVGPPRGMGEGPAGGGPIPFSPGGPHGGIFSPHELRPGVPPHMMPPGGQRLPASGAGHPRMPANPNFPGMRPPNSAQMVVRPNAWPPSTSAGPPPMMSNGPGPGGVGAGNLPTASPGGNLSHDGNPVDRFMMPVTNPGSVPSSFPMSTEGSLGGGETMMMNGDSLDMKNSPAGSSHGLNGGTPGPGGGGGRGGPGGGGRTPSGGPASVPSQGPAQPPSSDSMDFTAHPFTGDSEASEIDKIKRSMMEESKQFESKPTESGATGDGGDYY